MTQQSEKKNHLLAILKHCHSKHHTRGPISHHLSKLLSWLSDFESGCKHYKKKSPQVYSILHQQWKANIAVRRRRMRCKSRIGVMGGGRMNRKKKRTTFWWNLSNVSTPCHINRGWTMREAGKWIQDWLDSGLHNTVHYQLLFVIHFLCEWLPCHTPTAMRILYNWLGEIGSH